MVASLKSKNHDFPKSIASPPTYFVIAFFPRLHYRSSSPPVPPHLDSSWLRSVTSVLPKPGAVSFGFFQNFSCRSMPVAPPRLDAVDEFPLLLPKLLPILVWRAIVLWRFPGFVVWLLRSLMMSVWCLVAPTIVLVELWIVALNMGLTPRHLLLLGNPYFSSWFKPMFGDWCC